MHIHFCRKSKDNQTAGEGLHLPYKIDSTVCVGLLINLAAFLLLASWSLNASITT